MAALVTDHVQAWCPQSGGTRVLPARQLGPEIKIAGREVLCTVVTLPVVGAACTHAARRTTALFKNRHRNTSLLQGGSTRQAGQAGANDGATNGRIDQLMHSFDGCGSDAEATDPARPIPGATECRRAEPARRVSERVANEPLRVRSNQSVSMVIAAQAP